MTIAVEVLIFPTKLHAQEHAWGYNLMGGPGIIDMPTAHSFKDAELGFTINHFGPQTRTSISFQASNRFFGSLRYSRIGKISASSTSKRIVSELYDRSFGLHYNLLKEGDIRPSFSIGLNDVMGTGVYGGEYFVASKSLKPDFRVSLGIGWGRLGSYNGFTNPLKSLRDDFKNRPTVNAGQGGKFSPSSWFRGPAALFGGVEWRLSDRLHLLAEYSSDSYLRETAANKRNASQVNIGARWRYSSNMTLSGYYLYGTELGFQISYALNPKRSSNYSGREIASLPIVSHDMVAASTWDEADITQIDLSLRDELRLQGMDMEGMEWNGSSLRVAVRNRLHLSSAQAVGRTARVMSRYAPTEVDTFEVVLNHNGIPVSSVVMRRQDLEELETHPVAADLMRARSNIMDRVMPLSPANDVWPRTEFGLEPYLNSGFFDPDAPLRVDLGLSLYGRLEPAPGFVLAGRINQSVAGNMGNVKRSSDSVLPHVRSDTREYNRTSGPTLRELTAAWYSHPSEALFGRVTAGYLEQMFAGISAELLWKQQSSPFAIGVELSRVRQRDYKQHFGLMDYQVTTGHVSFHYRMRDGYHAQLDVGRYLAGDRGMTLKLSREFDNGWRISAFATRTNVSAEDFGEGSFDKGLVLEIPLNSSTGLGTRVKYVQTIRSIQRDGGAQLHVPGRLYDEVRNRQASEIDHSWGRFWR